MIYLFGITKDVEDTRTKFRRGVECEGKKESSVEQMSKEELELLCLKQK